MEMDVAVIVLSKLDTLALQQETRHLAQMFAQRFVVMDCCEEQQKSVMMATVFLAMVAHRRAPSNLVGGAVPLLVLRHFHLPLLRSQPLFASQYVEMGHVEDRKVAMMVT